MSSPPQQPTPAANPPNYQWFSENVHVHDSALKSYLRHTFPSARHEVDDVVQESYLRIWKSRAGRPLASAKAFLFKVARHVALDHLRRQNASPVELAEDVSTLAASADKALPTVLKEADEKYRILIEGLAELPPRGREVLILRKLEGLTQKEVATQLGISGRTVDEHLYRAMKRLEAYLRERGLEGTYDEP